MANDNSFIQQVEEFIQFAKFNVGRNGNDEIKFRCPYVDFLNETRLYAIEIREHLFCDDFFQNYTIWTWHDELINLPSVSQTKDLFHSFIEEWFEEYRLEDIILDVGVEILAKCMCMKLCLVMSRLHIVY